MQNRIILTALAAAVLLPLAGGCGSRFAGEWVQDSVVRADGTIAPLDAERRPALQFIPPSTIRMGMYLDAAGVVEPGTVTSSDYQTIQNRTVAQFGEYTARVEDGYLIAYIGGGRERGRFRKLQGESVFPPMVKLPAIVRAAPADENLLEGSAVAVAE